jgi:hypothetical protein
VRAALTALVATGIVVVAAPQTVNALPAGCTSTFNGNVNSLWSNAGNWSSGVPSGAAAVACIQSSEFPFLDVAASVGAVHIDPSAELTIGATGSLFVNGPTVSQWAPGSFVYVTGGRLGGTGRIVSHASVEFSGGSELTSINAPGGTSYAGPIGVLEVASDGDVRVLDSALALYTMYRIEVDGEMSLSNDAFIAADYGTATVIEVTGALRFLGSGGYYRGFPVAGQPLSHIGNHGLLEKGAGDPTVVDAWYVETATAQIQVNCCTELALPDETGLTAFVRPDHTMATGKCPAQATGVCVPSVDPAVDVSSVDLHIPDFPNTQVATVTIQELAQPPDTTDSRALGNDVYAHADQLPADPANPATITLRFSQADVMATPLAEVQVGHISDAGVMTKTPDCISGTIPPGAPYCIQRPVTRTPQNTFVTVLTTQTSRWRVRRQLPGESFDQTAPGPARNLVATLAPPGDGSKVALSWAAPATDGGAAVSAYRVHLDGRLLLATDGGTSAIVSDPGPGQHTLKVVAVNSIGPNAGADVAITIDKLSKPRKVKAVQGNKGGKLTAGAKWKAPADAGGFAISKYKVAVFKKNGKKVDTKVVGADQLKHLFKLKPGRYFFKVKARNTDRWGPWSKKTDLVRPR